MYSEYLLTSMSIRKIPEANPKLFFLLQKRLFREKNCRINCGFLEILILNDAFYKPLGFKRLILFNFYKSL